MLVALDLTARQAARVLTQAVQSHAKLELEPRPGAVSTLLWTTIADRDEDMLILHLHDAGEETSLTGLIGAMCDCRMILSSQLCMFSSFIVDVLGEGVPRQVVLAVPQTIQVANRRRFARRAPTQPVPIRLSLCDVETPFVAILSNIGAKGLGCRVVSRELEDALFIGDEVRVEFVLPWHTQAFALPASVCSKTSCGEEGHMIIGLEFVNGEDTSLLDELRAALNAETARLTGLDGEL